MKEVLNLDDCHCCPGNFDEGEHATQLDSTFDECVERYPPYEWECNMGNYLDQELR